MLATLKQQHAQELELMRQQNAILREELMRQRNKEEESKESLEAALAQWKRYAVNLLQQKTRLESERQQKIEAVSVQKERIKHLEDCVASMEANRKQLQDEEAKKAGIHAKMLATLKQQHAQELELMRQQSK
eukprot:EG_transcript_49374